METVEPINKEAAWNISEISLQRTGTQPAQKAPVVKPKPGASSMPDPDDDDEPGFLRRNLGKLIVGLLVVGSVGYFAFSGKPSGPVAPPPRVVEPPMIKVIVPPPPQPTPPPQPPKQQPPPPKEEKTVEQPVPNPPPAPVEKPPEGLGTNNKGPGPGLAGLGTSGNGVLGGTGIGKGGNGNAARWYASKVQARISEALKNNRKTRTAKLRVDVKVWPDKSGRLARVELAGSCGDPALDAVLRDEVLSGLQIAEAPPQGVNGPIMLRLSAIRPN